MLKLPETATLIEGAPALVLTIEPDKVPDAVFVTRTKMVVEAIEPEFGVNETVLPKPVPVEEETSNPDGAVINKSSVRLEAATVKVFSEETNLPGLLQF